MGALVGLAVALVAWAYWPGLSGPFLFDDFGNLDVLGAYGRINNWPTFLYYVSSGTADPIGRPLALLTFLLDANTWPASPWPFKRTNLLLHLANTALLGWVVARLQAALLRKRPELRLSPVTPALAAALWGAHPFFVSTTLYVIQREAMLPMGFVLLALLAWDRAATCFSRQQAGSGWAWAVAGFGGATVLAGLSKANGFLAPLLAGLAYVWFFRPDGRLSTARDRPMDTAAMLCLGVPSLLVLAYLLQLGWQLWSVPLGGRDWSLPERLLSEPRALWSYVWGLALPRAGGGGIYVDDFVASRGWLTPMTTLPAMVALAASAIAAVAWRHRFPIASFAWLFFILAHLMESTTVPLELYFEHRNYLPAMFLGWPVAHALLRPGVYPRYRAAAAALLLGTLLLLTHQRAITWGNPALLGALSAVDKTDSARAQVNAARQEIEQGNPVAGLARIRAVQHEQPGSVDVAITSIGMHCAITGALPEDAFARARHTLATAKTWNYGLYQWMQDAAADPTVRHCRGFGVSGLRALISAAEANPQSRTPRRQRDLLHVRGRVALSDGNAALGFRWFNAALLLVPDPEYALVQAAALGGADVPGLGVRHLDFYQHIQANQSTLPVNDMSSAHVWLLRHYGYYGNELSRLRERLQSDAERQSRKTTPQDAR